MGYITVPIEHIIDFEYGDIEGDIAREGYKKLSKCKRYAKLIKNGVKFPPIEVTKNFKLVDGMHRLTAYRILGIKEVEIYESI